MITTENGTQINEWLTTICQNVCKQHEMYRLIVIMAAFLPGNHIFIEILENL